MAIVTCARLFVTIILYLQYKYKRDFSNFHIITWAIFTGGDKSYTWGYMWYNWGDICYYWGDMCYNWGYVCYNWGDMSHTWGDMSHTEGMCPIPEGICPIPEGMCPIPEGTICPIPEGICAEDQAMYGERHYKVDVCYERDVDKNSWQVACCLSERPPINIVFIIAEIGVL